METLTSSSKNYIVGFGLDTKDKNINAGTGSVTAAKFIGNLTGNVTGYAGQISTVFTTSSATFTLTDGTSTRNIVFIY